MNDLFHIHKTDFLGMIMETDDAMDIITLDTKNSIAKYYSTRSDDEIERIINDEEL